MGRFLEQEKDRYLKLKQQSNLFSARARADGPYKGLLRPFCIPADVAEENLFAGVRADIQKYFARQSIKWHDGRDRGPSNHLCDSQVCCVYFLGVFADQPDALVALLKPVYLDIAEALPLEEEGRYVAFEWIGQHNYLNEKVRGESQRTRGANFTSADAAVRFRQEDGSVRVVLIEWKYTESYSPLPLAVAASGTSRVEIYRPLLAKPDCPIDLSKLNRIEDLFYEPFYQLMRQQLLAQQMELAREMNANKVSLLHLAPEVNYGFRRVTSPGLAGLGESAMAVWAGLVKEPGAFVSRSVEDLFRGFPVDRFAALREWWGYVAERYFWAV